VGVYLYRQTPQVSLWKRARISQSLGFLLGSVISDLFGTLGPGTLFGFLGNATMSWVSYFLWNRPGLVSSDDPAPYRIDSIRKIANFFLLAITGAVACAFIIAWGLQLPGLMPFPVIGIMIVVNNIIPVLILSLPIMVVLYPRIKSWGLFWTDIIGPEGVRLYTARTCISTGMVLFGTGLGFAGGLYGYLIAPVYSLIIGGIGIVIIGIGSQL